MIGAGQGKSCPDEEDARAAMSELHALLKDVGVASAEELGLIRVTGEDRVRWLNGMVTNSIQALAPGQGCYNFVLSAQGRVQAELTAFRLPETLLPAGLLLQVERSRIPALLALLDRFIIMDDVELVDRSALRTGLHVIGPAAAGRLAEVMAGYGFVVDGLPEMSMTDSMDSRLTVIHDHSPLVPRFQVWSTDAALLAEIEAVLGAAQASADDLEALRLLEGTPKFGVDIRQDKDLPQETAQMRALHFAKGCYLGQEIVERIRSRGQVHRTLAGFLLTGFVPPAGTPLHDENREIGELTSVVPIELEGQSLVLALATVRREALEQAAARAAALSYPGGEAHPVRLPYRAAIEPAGAGQHPTD